MKQQRSVDQRSSKQLYKEVHSRFQIPLETNLICISVRPFFLFLFLFRLFVTLCTILRAHNFPQNPASRCPIEFQDSMHSGSPNSTPQMQVSVPNPDEPLASLALLASWARPRSYQYLSLKDLHGILLFIRNTLFGEWPFYFLCRLHTSVRTETGSMESLELNDDVPERHGMECCRGHTFLPSHLF